MTQEITDEFEIRIGKGFIVESATKRKGAVHPEPYDANRIGDWLIQELGLKDCTTYTLKISASVANQKTKTEEEILNERNEGCPGCGKPVQDCKCEYPKKSE